MPAVLHIPERDQATPFCLALFICAGEGPALNELRGRVLDSNHATLTLCWPLTGPRRSPKMSETLISAVLDRHATGGVSALCRQFDLQARAELLGAFKAAASLPEIDVERLALLDLTFLATGAGAAKPRRNDPSASAENHWHRAQENCDAAEASRVLEDFLERLLP